jgi:hypothetical protein
MIPLYLDWVLASHHASGVPKNNINIVARLATLNVNNSVTKSEDVGIIS